MIFVCNIVFSLQYHMSVENNWLEASPPPLSIMLKGPPKCLHPLIEVVEYHGLLESPITYSCCSSHLLSLPLHRFPIHSSRCNGFPLPAAYQLIIQRWKITKMYIFCAVLKYWSWNDSYKSHRAHSSPQIWSIFSKTRQYNTIPYIWRDNARLIFTNPSISFAKFWFDVTAIVATCFVWTIQKAQILSL